MKNFKFAFLFLAGSLVHGTVLNEFPSLSMNQEGKAVAFWQGFDNIYNTSIIRTASFSLEEGWNGPIDISTSGKLAMYPKIAVNPLGNMIGVWEVALGNTFSIQAIAGSFDSGWRIIELISESTDEDTFPEIDIDGSGNGVLLWQKKEGGSYVVRTSAYSAETEIWSPPITLSSSSRTMPFPEAAVNSSGKALAVWQRFSDSGNRIEASSFSPEESWSSPTVLSNPNYNSTNAHAALNEGGEGIALWQEGRETSVLIQAAICSSEGVWGEATTLSPLDGISANPMAVMNGSGKIIAVWQSAYPEDVTLQVVQSAIYADGVWSSLTSLSDPSLKATFPSIAMNDGGEAILLWVADGVVQSSLLSADNIWSSPTPLSDPGQTSFYPQAGIDSMGNCLAIWQTNTGDATVIQGSKYTAGASWSPVSVISEPSTLISGLLP